MFKACFCFCLTNSTWEVHWPCWLGRTIQQYLECHRFPILGLKDKPSNRHPLWNPLNWAWNSLPLPDSSMQSENHACSQWHHCQKGPAPIAFQKSIHCLGGREGRKYRTASERKLWYLCFCQSAEGLQDFVLKQVLQTGPCLPRWLLLLLVR